MVLWWYCTLVSGLEKEGVHIHLLGEQLPTVYVHITVPVPDIRRPVEPLDLWSGSIEGHLRAANNSATRTLYHIHTQINCSPLQITNLQIDALFSLPKMPVLFVYIKHILLTRTMNVFKIQYIFYRFVLIHD